MAQGVLSGKYKPGAPAPAGSRGTDPIGSELVAESLDEEILNRIQELAPIAAEIDLTLAQLAIAWTLQNPNVSAAIVGATRPAQVRENAMAAGIRIPPALLQQVDDILEPIIESDPAQTMSPLTAP
jgi:aryl-alcohol dehydrogenase-like predicted oxidoreductase